MASLIKRGNFYYAQYMVGKKAKRVSLETSSLQLAKDKVRQLESSFYRGGDNPLPTKTPIADVVTDYIEYMGTRKTARSVVRDTYYLRESFGPICPALTLKNAKISVNGKKHPTRQAPQYPYHYSRIVQQSPSTHRMKEVSPSVPLPFYAAGLNSSASYRSIAI